MRLKLSQCFILYCYHRIRPKDHLCQFSPCSIDEVGTILFSAQRSGMDLELFWHSIRASAGNSFLWETAGPNIFRGEYHDSFNMDLMCKDIQLCFEMAKSAKVISCFIAKSTELYSITVLF